MSFFTRGFRKLETISDKILIIKCRNGDREAFGKIYLKYLDQIYRYIYFRVNQNKEIAEDIAEVVFFKAWGNLNEFRDKNDSFRSWLYRIAHNAVIDHYRQNQHLVRLEETIGDHQNLEEQILRQAEQDEMVKSLNKLTDEQKQVVILKYIEGLSHAEIAGIMKKKEEAIRALQYRALKELRRLLK